MLWHCQGFWARNFTLASSLNPKEITKKKQKQKTLHPAYCTKVVIALLFTTTENWK